jgi:hypothetical protein
MFVCISGCLAAFGKQKGFLQVSLTYHAPQLRLCNAALAAAAAAAAAAAYGMG